MEKDYISVKEFAERAGVSTQAIYQRIDKDLQGFCKVVGKKKMLDIAGLELFQKQEPLQAESKPLEADLLKTMQATLQALTAQLEIKDKQLQQAAEEKAELLQRLKDAQASEQQAHALHAGTMQQQITAGAEVIDATEPERKRGFFSFFTGKK